MNLCGTDKKSLSLTCIMEIAERIKTLRKEAGLSQEELSERIGVSRQAVTKWETGAGLPDVYNLKALAEEFDTTIDNLMRREIDEQPAPRESDGLKTSCMYDVVEQKTFDINIGACRNLTVKESLDGKVEVLTNKPDTFIKIDEHKGLIDIDFKKRQNVSCASCKEGLDIEILLPKGLVRHVEMDVVCSSILVEGVSSDLTELGGKFTKVTLKDNCCPIEIDCNLDLVVEIDGIDGSVEINQWKATSRVFMRTDSAVAYLDKGRKCSLSVSEKLSGSTVEYVKGQTANVVFLNGYKSELYVQEAE